MALRYSHFYTLLVVSEPIRGLTWAENRIYSGVSIPECDVSNESAAPASAV
jgi:hypothetical protein